MGGKRQGQERIDAGADRHHHSQQHQAQDREGGRIAHGQQPAAGQQGLDHRGNGTTQHQQGRQVEELPHPMAQGLDRRQPLSGPRPGEPLPQEPATPLQQGDLSQWLIQAPLGEQLGGKQVLLGQEPQKQGQHQGNGQGPQGPGGQQPGLVWEGGPGAGQHDRIEHRRSKQEAEGRGQRCSPRQQAPGHGHVAALTGRQGKAQSRPGEGAQQGMGRQALQPPAPRTEPAGQGGDHDTDHQKWQGLNHQALKDRPHGAELVHADHCLACRPPGHPLLGQAGPAACRSGLGG